VERRLIHTWLLAETDATRRSAVLPELSSSALAAPKTASFRRVEQNARKVANPFQIDIPQPNEESNAADRLRRRSGTRLGDDRSLSSVGTPTEGEARFRAALWPRGGIKSGSPALETKYRKSGTGWVMVAAHVMKKISCSDWSCTTDRCSDRFPRERARRGRKRRVGLIIHVSSKVVEGVLRNPGRNSVCPEFNSRWSAQRQRWPPPIVIS